MVVSDEEAKAVQELAKLGKNTVAAAEKAGGYLTATFRGAIGHLAQAAEDSAYGFRTRNAAKVEQKTRTCLKKLGVDSEYKLIDQRNAIPLVEAIEIESDGGLQDLWAAYVANALDPKQPSVTVNRQLITVMKNLEPSDLPIIRRLCSEKLNEAVKDPIKLSAQDFSVNDANLVESLARLAALGVFTLQNDGSVGWAAHEGYRMPCQLEVTTSIGVFRAQALLLVFQQSVRV
jgi:hypothetical protein